MVSESQHIVRLEFFVLYKYTYLLDGRMVSAFN